VPIEWRLGTASAARQADIRDSHYGRSEVMDFFDNRGIDFIFGLSSNPVLDRADDIRTRRAPAQAPAIRGYAETLYQAKSWIRPSPGQRPDAPVHRSKRSYSASISVSW
jgi:Transposase DDE domain group 1